MFEFIKDNYLKLIGGLVIIIACLGGIFFFIGRKKVSTETTGGLEIIEEVENSEPILEEVLEDVKLLRVDVKGLVNKPGVYEVPEGTIINSVLELAGGLKKGGTTKNINLSKKVSDEMVIYVYSDYQLNKLNDKSEVKECNTSNVDISSCSGASVIVSSDEKEIKTNNKISINKGTKEQLMTLSGIGESKALAIIKYREDNNGFKTLEEIMNVSGIGEAAYNKIKDNIEL